MAKKIGMHVKNYQKIEKGARNPKLITAITIAKILETPIEDLFGDI